MKMNYGSTYVADALSLRFPLGGGEVIRAFQFDPRKSYVTPIPDDGRIHIVCPAGRVKDITNALDNNQLYIEGVEGLEIAVHPTNLLPTNGRYHCLK